MQYCLLNTSLKDDGQIILDDLIRIFGVRYAENVIRKELTIFK